MTKEIGHIVVLFVIVLIFAASADATTSATSSTTSKFASQFSDAYILRTVSNNQQSSPDLSFGSMGLVSTLVQKSPDGSSETTQTMYFSADNVGDPKGYCTQSSNVVGSGVKEINEMFRSNMEIGLATEGDPTKVESTSIGAGLVAADSDLYSLSVTGGHTTKTNAALVRVPIESINPTTFSLSFDINPVEFDTSAQVFNQDVSVNYGVINNNLDYYAYDFGRVIWLDDIGFKADMTVICDE
jgi:hypothetical protein